MSTSAHKLLEAYPRATGTTDQEGKQSNNDNKLQLVTTDVQDGIMADDHCRADKSPRDTEAIDTTDYNPTNKVGCHSLTMQINQYITNHYITSQESAKSHLIRMLEILDKFLYHNPSKHQTCMQLDSEFKYLIREIINLKVDISTFPTIWAVLSIIITNTTTGDEYNHDI